jgi:hypothetical protein
MLINWKRRPTRLIRKAVESVKNNSWAKEVKRDREEMQIAITAGRDSIKKAVLKRFQETLIKEGEKKSKVQYYIENSHQPQAGKGRKYIKKGTRHVASNIFMARSRMVEAKCNYKNMHQNLNCRFCNRTEETQNRIMEVCTEIDRGKFPAVKVEEIFSEEANNLQSIADKIYNLGTLLKNTSAAPSAQAEG